jgi:hypothetical protein
MKKIIPLIFSVLYVLNFNAQAVGGWGTCEFADVATMNAFDPSTNAYDCKKVFVQATNNHYYWNGTIWVLVQGTDDQNASEVPFTPVGTIVATDVQAAIAEIEPDIYGSVGVHSNVDVTTITPSGGDVLAWDGSNFVPLTLEAANIPYDNTASSLTATDMQAAIDELGVGSSSTNIYTDNGTLGANRTVSMDGNDLTFSDNGSGEKVQIGTFGGNGGGKLQVDVTDGDALRQGIKTAVVQTTGYNYAINGTANGVGAIRNTGLYGYADGATNNWGLWISSGFGIFDDKVGIGTTSPDAQLDVEGGQVRFSDYGETPGNYEDTTAVYLLGVDPNGDVMEMNTAKNSRIFYPPAMVIVVDSVGTGFDLNVHKSYTALFSGGGSSFVKSTTAPGAIPTYAADELYYYILDYDDSIFDNVTINDVGIMEYDIIATAVNNCSFINIVFVVKEP